MATDELSVTFTALADPTRRAILARLAQSEATVMELARPFDLNHAEESRLVLEELADLQAELEAELSDSAAVDEPAADPSAAAMGDTLPDPAAASPKRARWLAGQMRHAEPTPSSRRQFLTRATDPS